MNIKYILKLLIWLACAIGSSVCGTNIITTVAGVSGSPAATGGTGGRATSATLNSPQGVYGDSLGNIYIAETSGCCIRRFNTANNIMLLHAGTCGSCAFSNGPATAGALFSLPLEMFVDTTGAMLTSEQGTGSYYARRVSTSAIVSTVAGKGSGGANAGDGGPATSATLNGPESVTMDTTYNIYVVCTLAVRKISAGGIITNFAGTNIAASSISGVQATSSPFTSLFHVEFDTVGVAYLSDNGGHKVSKISTGGILTTYAGTGTSTPASTATLPATSANMNLPMGLAVDSTNGDMYIAQRSACYVTLVTGSSGQASIYAGTGSPNSDGDGGPAASAAIGAAESIYRSSGRVLYVATWSSNLIRAIYSIDPTSQPSGQPSGQPSQQPSSQPSRQPTVQPSCQPSQQPSTQPSQQPTGQPSAQPSSQPTLQPSSQPTVQPTNQPSRQPSVQPTQQPSSQPSCQPTSQPSVQPTRQPSTQPTLQPSSWPTSQPSVQPSARPSCQPSVQPSARPTTQPTSQPSRQPTTQPVSAPTQQPSSQPTGQPSIQPTTQPTQQPTRQPSLLPSCQPTSQPSSQPLVHPTAQPSRQPSTQPSRRPSSQPSSRPTTQPSRQPSAIPSRLPSSRPSKQPSSQPSRQPSRQPVSRPSRQPSRQPSGTPSRQPAGAPSSRPSRQPSAVPSVQPTSVPSALPSSQPSGQPSRQPSGLPSGLPTSQPLSQPSTQPSGQPSVSPTVAPSVVQHFNRSISVLSMGPFQTFQIVIPFTTLVSGASTNSAFSDVLLSPGVVGTVYKADVRRSIAVWNAGFGYSNASAVDTAKRSISVLPDVSGDGLPDLIIGDPYSAVCYVLFGNPEGLVDMIMGFSVYGELSSDLTGWSVSGAGDVNNDGLKDIIIGAPFAKGVGAFYVIYGRRKNVVDVHLTSLPSTVGFAVYGEQKSDYLGISVSGAGNVNGDEYADVVVGSVSIATYASGAAYVAFGSAEGVASLHDCWRLTGSSYSYAGNSVGFAGDLNGDGLDEVLIGSAPTSGSQPQVTVVFGVSNSANTSVSLDALSSAEGFTLSGAGTIGGGLNGILLYSNLPSVSRNGVILFTNVSQLPHTSSPETPRPTLSPTAEPTLYPTRRPTLGPTSLAPSLKPTRRPTAPTEGPTAAATTFMSVSPTEAPSVEPTESPTASPTVEPSQTPTRPPTPRPSTTPTVDPSHAPTLAPTLGPTALPTTSRPTIPSATRTPVSRPSMSPTNASVVILPTEVMVTTSASLANQTMRGMHYIVNTSGAVSIDNRHGSNLYTVVPAVNGSLTIVYFNVSCDLIDLTHFAFISVFSDLHLSAGSVIVSFPGKQRIRTANLHPADMTSSNFVFAPMVVASNEDGEGHAGDAVALGVAFGAVGLWLSLVLIMQHWHLLRSKFAVKTETAHFLFTIQGDGDQSGASDSDNDSSVDSESRGSNAAELASVSEDEAGSERERRDTLLSPRFMSEDSFQPSPRFMSEDSYQPSLRGLSEDAAEGTWDWLPSPDVSPVLSRRKSSQQPHPPPQKQEVVWWHAEDNGVSGSSMSSVSQG